MTWSRPPGPPKIWRVIEVANKDGKKFKFSIQEIPEDRYDEALDHMCNLFLNDEAMCSSIKVTDERESVAVFRAIWTSLLQQGISVAAYEQFDDSTIKPVLAGLNVLELVNENTEKISTDNMPAKIKKVCDFVLPFMTEGDPRKFYKVDTYLSGFGLSVDPRYRGLQLGQRLLEVRDDVGKAYGIPVTGTLFSSATSQKVAARAGFEDYLSRAYGDGIDDQGKIAFPLLQGKSAKIMIKRL